VPDEANRNRLPLLPQSRTSRQLRRRLTAVIFIYFIYVFSAKFVKSIPRLLAGMQRSSP